MPDTAVLGPFVAAAALGVAFVLYYLRMPHCPECGSVRLIRCWDGPAIWVCLRCDAVFRMR